MREQRAGYRQRLCSVWKEMLQTKPNVKWLELSSEEDLMQTTEPECVRGTHRPWRGHRFERGFTRKSVHAAHQHHESDTDLGHWQARLLKKLGDGSPAEQPQR